MSVTTVRTPAEAATRPACAPESGVPWSFVLPWAVALAFGNGFWIVALRGVVGSIERTSAPFASWLRESTLLVPWYVLAVVVGLAAALRRFGSRPRGVAATAGSLGLVAAAGTVAGTVVLVSSSVIDYVLQSDHLARMAVTHPGCDATCLDETLRLTWHLELRANLLGVALLAVTDLVLVALVLALRGGGLRAGRVRTTSGAGPTDGHVALAACLLGAGAVHAAVVPEHVDEWAAAGAFFVLLALAEAGVAGGVLTRRPATRHRAAEAAVAVSLVPLLIWAASRTAGLPFGPDAGRPEAVGGADVVACVLELAALVIALRLLHPHPREQARSRHAHAVALAAVVTATTLGVGCTTLPVVGLFPGIAGGHQTNLQDERGSTR